MYIFATQGGGHQVRELIGRIAVDGNVVDMQQRSILKRYAEFGRSEIRDLRFMLTLAAPLFADASSMVAQLHSPMPDEGQGSGSAMGRDPDILVVKADHGLHYKLPKDRFACAALAVLYQAEELERPKKRGAKKGALERLNCVWGHFTNDKPPNWDRVIRDCEKIYRSTVTARDFWREVAADA